MNTDILLSAVALAAWLILVLSGIRRRGMAPARIVALALIWVAIIGIAWLAARILLPYTHFT